MPKAVKYLGVRIKQCSKCKEFKKVEEFHRGSGTSDGLKSWCKDCMNGCSKQWSIRNSERVNESSKRWKMNNPERTWAGDTLRRHRRRGFEVDMSIDALTELAKNTEECPLCGRELDWSLYTKGHLQPNSPSLDRINNGDALTSENVWIICQECNTTKGARTLIEFARYCKNILAMLKDIGVKVE